MTKTNLSKDEIINILRMKDTIPKKDITNLIKSEFKMYKNRSFSGDSKSTYILYPSSRHKNESRFPLALTKEVSRKEYAIIKSNSIVLFDSKIEIDFKNKKQQECIDELYEKIKAQVFQIKYAYAQQLYKYCLENNISLKKSEQELVSQILKITVPIKLRNRVV